MPNTEATTEVPVEAPTPEVQLGDQGEMSFEDAMAQALIGDAEVAPESPVSPAPVTETPEVLAAPAPVTEAPSEPTTESAQESRSLARIMERESELQSKVDAYDSSQAELNELRSRLDRYEGAQSSFTADPISFIRSIAPEGTDLKRLAEGLWNENLGEKAPPQYLQQKAATHQNTEQGARLAKLEQANVERDTRYQQEAAQRAEGQYLGSLNSYAESVSQEASPLVSLMQARDPATVADAMENIARHYVRQTNGQILTPEQVGAKYEEYLSKHQLRPEVKQEATPPPAQGTSLRNSSNQIQPDRELEDTLSDEYLHRKALESIGLTV
jgi:hypothetical protein